MIFLYFVLLLFSGEDRSDGYGLLSERETYGSYM